MAVFDLDLALPADPLRGLITGYHRVSITAAPPLVDYTVPEWGSIRFVLAGDFDVVGADDQHASALGAFVLGPSSRPVRFEIADCIMVGVGLTPTGFARFWNANLAALADISAPLDAFMPSASALHASLCAGADLAAHKASLDAHFLTQLEETRPGGFVRQVSDLHALLNDPETVRVESVAAHMAMAPATLSAFCRRHFGFGPKLLLRRQRFLRMLDALHARPYAEWPAFVDPNYADQSHMIRDFRDFMGMSPSQYLALPRPVQRASAEKRRELFGGALQGLR